MYEIIAVWGTLLQNEHLWDQKRCKGKCRKEVNMWAASTPQQPESIQRNHSDNRRRWHNSRLSNPKLVKKFPSFWKENTPLTSKICLCKFYCCSYGLKCVLSAQPLSIFLQLSDGSRRDGNFINRSWAPTQNDGGWGWARAALSRICSL